MQSSAVHIGTYVCIQRTLFTYVSRALAANEIPIAYEYE